MFLLSTNKEDTLSLVWDQRINEAWRLNFRRRLFAWEQEEFSRLLSILSCGPVVNVGHGDCMVWNAGAGESFSTTAMFRWSQQTRGSSFPHMNLVWNKVVPPKVQFFAWLAWKGKIKTSTFLQRIGVLDVQTSNSCCFCNVCPESIEHVFLHCPIVWRIWAGLFSWWGFSGVLPESICGLFEWWSGFKFRGALKKLWEAIPSTILYSIWKIRNDCRFNSIQPKWEEALDQLKMRLVLWVKDNSGLENYSIQDFIYNLNSIRALL